MRLPKRVPWSSISELEQVCSWIYVDEDDIEAKILAVNRLSAWKAVTPLPHALDSTLDILAVQMLDASCRDEFLAKTILSLRQTYAAVIIRMVNGLVDPLQSGAYARSIAAIATQLGLPSWLVELRHAATHEDLPSLELLREASKESLSWLLHNYFHPTLNPSAHTSAASSSLRPVAPLLKSYKCFMKTVIRDGSLRKQYQDEIDAVMRSIERWVVEAKVSVEPASSSLAWGFDDNSSDVRVDIKEKCALELICTALLERGAIVPVSKRKCSAPMNPFLPTATSLALWTPLLVQLHATHTAFPSIFTSRIISVLLDDPAQSVTDTDVAELDCKSLPTIHKEYLARWASWAVRTWTDEAECGSNLRKDIILQVASAFTPGNNSGSKTKILNELLQAVSTGFKDLEECIEFLRSTAAAVPTHAQPWNAHDLIDMEERLQRLTTSEFQTSEFHGYGPAVKGGAEELGKKSGVDGWRLLDNHSSWVPCPIGVYLNQQCT